MQIIKSLFIAAAFFQAFGLSAQSAIGFRAGIHLATISDIQDIVDPNVDPEYITGLNFAAYTELGISGMFAIQPEINFLQKGSKIEGRDIEDHTDVSLKVVANYLEVPVLAKLRFGTDRFKAFALIGPSVGYALGGEATYTLHGITSKEKIEFDKNIDDDGMKDQRWDISGIVGAGGTLAAGPGSIVLDLRYGMDFTDFVKFKDSAPAGYDKSYNRGFGISLGYQVPIMKS